MYHHQVRSVARWLVGTSVTGIIIGVFLCVLGIWEAVEGEVFWRSFATLAVVTGGCILSAIVLLISMAVQRER